MKELCHPRVLPPQPTASGSFPRHLDGFLDTRGSDDCCRLTTSDSASASPAFNACTIWYRFGSLLTSRDYNGPSKAQNLGSISAYERSAVAKYASACDQV
ncbi:hypothetical protein PF011_g23269 [Phytophthora fragariae]|uniref:Uncharacterized protein n=1 Tax=Phytophthora fragariae TaxID=53985 RepID=A0A6A3I888_9STRA|nr:hypothetical protein PF011_g23269 [Phytophthora fragariae]